MYPSGAASDPFRDQQTGDLEGDIVGTAANPSLYKAFDDGGTPDNHTDGSIGLRVRIAGESNPPGFTGAFYVGLDANGDGKIDLFIGALTGGSTATVGLFAPGTGANNSPSTTSIQTKSPLYSETISTSNYNWQGVTLGASGNDPTATTNDVDGGGQQDFFLSIVLPFNQVVAALNSLGFSGVTDQTAMSFIAATSQNTNSLNQDLNGVNGGLSSSSTFAQLGGLTLPYSSSGALPIPEPSSIGLLAMCSAAGLLVSRRRTRSR